MQISTSTQYKCDGCGKEAINPRRWVTVGPISIPGFGLLTQMPQSTEDYCPECRAIMKDALKGKTHA